MDLFAFPWRYFVATLFVAVIIAACFATSSMSTADSLVKKFALAAKAAQGGRAPLIARTAGPNLSGCDAPAAGMGTVLRILRLLAFARPVSIGARERARAHSGAPVLLHDLPCVLVDRAAAARVAATPAIRADAALGHIDSGC
jgi:hypothetical protein